MAWNRRHFLTLLTVVAGRPLWSQRYTTDGGATPASGASAKSSPFRNVGVALTPAHFPHQSAQDIDLMFQQARQLGEYGVFIHQWQDPNGLATTQQVMAMGRRAGLKMALAVSPTKLSGMRNELDVPDDLRKSMGGRPSFSQRAVQDQFRQHALELAKLMPEYLCLATEINFLAFKNIKEYVAFAETVKEIYPELKKISPQTKIFVSFQWDYYHKMDEMEPNKIEEHSKLIDIFRPALDVVAFTSYPSPKFKTVQAIPSDYYARISRHAKSTDEVGFMEMGWPASSEAAMQEQATFIERLPELLGPLQQPFVWWSLLHDISQTLFSSDLSSTGLITNDDTLKPGFGSFKKVGRGR
jgi:hypothetical protein